MSDENGTAVADEVEEPTSIDTIRRRSSEREETYEPGDEAVNAAGVTVALVQGFSAKAATNGNTIKADLEIDTGRADEFLNLIGDSTYEFRFSEKKGDGFVPTPKKFGECRVLSCSTKSDADNVAHTKIQLQWDASQTKTVTPLIFMVGLAGRLELHKVQLEVWGTKA